MLSDIKITPADYVAEGAKKKKNEKQPCVSYDSYLPPGQTEVC